MGKRHFCPEVIVNALICCINPKSVVQLASLRTLSRIFSFTSLFFYGKAVVWEQQCSCGKILGLTNNC